MGTECMVHESIWFERHSHEEAEELNQLHLNGLPLPVHHDHEDHGHHFHGHGHHGKKDHHDDKHHDHHNRNQHHENQHHGKNQHDHHQDHHHGKQDHKHEKGSSTSMTEIAEARRKIQQTLSGAPPSSASHAVSEKRVQQLEDENKELRQKTNELAEAMKKLELRVAQLESGPTTTPAATSAKEEKKVEKKEEEKKDDSDSDDLFGSESEEEDEEKERIKQERLAAYYAKKSTKAVVIAKSNIILDVKPWDDETDVKEIEKKVRSIVIDGLLWGASKFVEIAYGIKKLQISCVVEDDKVGTELLEESITAFEDLVQSVDIVAFNKV